jgi:hypothetical protein
MSKYAGLIRLAGKNCSWKRKNDKGFKILGSIQRSVKRFRKWGNCLIRHPLASVDPRISEMDCTTAVSAYDPPKIAKMVMKVDDRATNSFMQQIRRMISIFESP